LPKTATASPSARPPVGATGIRRGARGASSARAPQVAAEPAGVIDEPELLDADVHRTLAARLREERRRSGLTLVDVAGRSGLSTAMVSKIENSQTSPSLNTLARLAVALEVPITSFFRGLEEERDATFVPAGTGVEMVRLGTRHGHRYELLAVSKSGVKAVQPYLVTLTEQSEAFPIFQHEGIEFLYQLEGSLTYRYGRHTYDMEPGDSLMFYGRVAHGPEHLSRVPIRFLSITIDIATDRESPEPTARASAGGRSGRSGRRTGAGRSC
jgi:ribosome-binding protein aMBF1 (putative translation factor)